MRRETADHLRGQIPRVALHALPTALLHLVVDLEDLPRASIVIAQLPRLPERQEIQKLLDGEVAAFGRVGLSTPKRTGSGV